MNKKIFILVTCLFFFLTACSLYPKTPPANLEPYFTDKQIVSGIREFWDNKECGFEFEAKFALNKTTSKKEHATLKLVRENYTFKSVEEMDPKHQFRYVHTKKICP